MLCLNNMTKTNLGDALSGLHPSKEKSKQKLGNKNLGTGTEAETTEEYCLLVYSPCLSKSPYITQDHLPRGGTTHSWALSYQPYIFLQANLKEACSQLKLPLPKWPWFIWSWQKTRTGCLMHLSFMSLRNNKVFWAREMVQQLNEQVAYRGPSFNSQHLHDGAKPSATPIPGDPMPSLDCMGIRYIHGAQTCMQAKCINT